MTNIILTLATVNKVFMLSIEITTMVKTHHQERLNSRGETLD